MFEEKSVINGNGQDEEIRKNQSINKKHNEKHARFSVANVMNLDPKVNGEQNNVEPLNGSCILESSSATSPTSGTGSMSGEVDNMSYMAVSYTHLRAHET